MKQPKTSIFNYLITLTARLFFTLFHDPSRVLSAAVIIALFLRPLVQSFHSLTTLVITDIYTSVHFQKLSHQQQHNKHIQFCFFLGPSHHSKCLIILIYSIVNYHNELGAIFMVSLNLRKLSHRKIKSLSEGYLVNTGHG